MKVYKLVSDSRNCSSFIENYPEGEKSSLSGIMGLRWKPLEGDFESVKLELWRSDRGKKNYQFDFSASLRPFLVFSEHAFDKLKDILIPRGQVLPIITESKRKRFLGYYPTNPLKGCLDMEKSNYKIYPRGMDISKHVLISGNICDDYFFTIEECVSSIFVTSKFRERVEEHDLIGFDFSQVVSLS